VRNAVRVFSIYRIGDVGLFMAMWASHHLWHENITFSQLNEAELVHEHLAGHTGSGIFISLMILIPAMAKSAQIPFSSWLPRAMEGPTPSSAIFYGSLSVHVGAFLLIRTYPFWSEQTSVRILIAGVGLMTALFTFFIARVQSSVKSKIAYSSITQIGLIFIEIADGFHGLALLHFMGNAFLRTYQLLVSPSTVSYLVRDQFYHFNPHQQTAEERWPRWMSSTLYMISLREWNLDQGMNRWVFKPFKTLGHELDFLSIRNVIYIVIPVYVLFIVMLINKSELPPIVQRFNPLVAATIGLLMVLKAFSERYNPLLSWIMIVMMHFWIILAISFHAHFEADHMILYLSGVCISGLAGYLILRIIRKREKKAFSLNAYFGHVYEYPRQAFLFLISALGLMGFPITSTFIGEDVIFSHVNEEQYFIAFVYALCFVLSGIALIRVYARIYLGPHCKTYHPTSLRVS
jgi:formate hydrogenlyase subunit 3/multisubunit Na+/H+ antiporter MnhD subunit